jgi:signal transduction histidine kinase
MVSEGAQRGLPEDFLRFVQQIRSGGSHLNVMLTNLMDVSAASQGRVPLQICEVNVASWCQSVRDILDPLAAARDLPPVQWELEMDEISSFRSDPVRLSQVLINLVHNALKFSSTGGIVTVKVVHKDTNLTLQVLDRGCGLPDDPSVLFKVFERNEVGISDSEHGAGLGLYIVKTSLDLLGGKIFAQNRAEGGAVFEATIPEAFTPT